MFSILALIISTYPIKYSRAATFSLFPQCITTSLKCKFTFSYCFISGYNESILWHEQQDWVTQLWEEDRYCCKETSSGIANSHFMWPSNSAINTYESLNVHIIYFATLSVHVIFFVLFFSLTHTLLVFVLFCFCHRRVIVKHLCHYHYFWKRGTFFDVRIVVAFVSLNHRHQDLCLLLVLLWNILIWFREAGFGRKELSFQQWLLNNFVQENEEITLTVVVVVLKFCIFTVILLLIVYL